MKRELRLGVIGYGERIGILHDVLRSLNAGAEVTSICDLQPEKVQQKLSSRGIDPAAVRFYTDVDAMLDAGDLDGVFIGTRDSLHTPLAIEVLARDLPLFLEKPVATSMEQLLALREAWEKSNSEVVVSFPLRVTPLVRLAKEITDSGKIGTVEHVQAWNNVPYGWVYFMDWYRDENETQGLFLQKATHDFDYINHLLGLKPSLICAMTSKRVYKGDHPAGLSCDVCDEQDRCPESPFNLFFTRGEADSVQPSNRICGFAVDTGNEDSGSAIIRYETGMHVSYSQNFFARRSAAARGARLFGYEGTLEFDWYTDEVKVHMHHAPRVETHKLDSVSLSHGGGDNVLVDSFVRVVRDGAKSVAPLDAGLLSVLMCLKAKESAETDTFQRIEYPDSG